MEALKSLVWFVIVASLVVIIVVEWFSLFAFTPLWFVMACLVGYAILKGNTLLSKFR